MFIVFGFSSVPKGATNSIFSVT
uniref:Uncharacterized protein n=1 Tax=Rhizophora mucronata TaxID=61149 RepID=A0A2P2QBQ7_RHIMU